MQSVAIIRRDGWVYFLEVPICCCIEELRGEHSIRNSRPLLVPSLPSPFLLSPPLPPPDNETCTKAPVAPRGYVFVQGMGHAGDNIPAKISDDMECDTLPVEFSAGWTELAMYCSDRVECVAVSQFWTGTNYKFCLKSNATNLTASPDTMPQACLGTLVKLPPSPSPPPTASCATAAVAPAGWTFMPKQMGSVLSTLVCRGSDATAPYSWPTEQIDACLSMPQCLTVDYSIINSHNDTGFCYTSSRDGVENASEYMPQACMGVMVKDGEWTGGWGGWSRWLEETVATSDGAPMHNPRSPSLY